MLTLFARFAPMLAAEAVATGGRPIPDWAKGNTIFETFFKGGPVMYPIVAVLVVCGCGHSGANRLVDDPVHSPRRRQIGQSLCRFGTRECGRRG